MDTKMKLFGIELFNRKRRMNSLLEQATGEAERNKVLPDFASGFSNQFFNEEFLEVVADDSGRVVSEKKIRRGRPAKKIQFTPKGVYEAKWLNDGEFKIITDPKYVESQLEDFKERLALIKSHGLDMRNGVRETESILIRMENRKKYADHKKFFEQFPYTKTSKIDEILKIHTHLKLGNVEQFVPSLPKEAIQVMKDYKAETQKLCSKDPVFYIIASKEDFRQTNKRKDPILLAQSPFAHVWQILGAWDEEMILLEDL